jgi:hypothetical protein
MPEYPGLLREQVCFTMIGRLDCVKSTQPLFKLSILQILVCTNIGLENAVLELRSALIASCPSEKN